MIDVKKSKVKIEETQLYGYLLLIIDLLLTSIIRKRKVLNAF